MIRQRLWLIVVSFFLLTSYTYAGTIIVNSTADTNARGDNITLREAIMLSEGTLNFALLMPEEQTQVSTPVGRGIADTINFGISGTIIARSSLPTITDDGTIIDASSQWIGEWPGGEPGVILDGDWNGDGLTIIGANSCHIRGLFMKRFMSGISIFKGGKLNTIGGVGTGYRNIISGNDEGMRIANAGTDSNIISGNYIGTDATGTADLGNNGAGIVITDSARLNIIGGTTAGERNIISGNDGSGVGIAGLGTESNVVKGNYIGTDAAGTVALGNAGSGIFIGEEAQLNTIGGATAEDRNIISGNGTGIGLMLAAHNNIISGNYIGTDVTGTVDLGNTGRYTGHGVWIKDGYSNTIGGATAGEGNVISGNDEFGILIEGVPSSESETFNNVVLGNYIGTDVTGTKGLGNLYCGVGIITGAQSNTIGVGNTIAFNHADGIFIQGGGTDFNRISGNYIHNNGSNGIHVLPGSQSNVIGTVGAGNTIAFNDENGILIEGGGSDFNRISGNSIHDNTGLGIDLVRGGNDEIQPPSIILASLGGDVLTVSGEGAGADAAVEIFIADSSGQEGQTYLGSLTADRNGKFWGSLNVTGSEITVGDRIVATATHTDNNTSEFGPPHTVLKRQGTEGVGPILNPANGHYYEVVIEQINWDDAKAAAENRTFSGLQGHLATITSQDENDFITSILPTSIPESPYDINLWIGGFQPPGSPEPDGNWQWVTGEAFVYQNWVSGEPNNEPYESELNEDNLDFRQHGRWNDGPGKYDAAGYIVEYEPEARRLSITSAEAAPGDQVSVQLNISDATDMASGDVVIEYDPGVITVSKVTAMDLLADMLLIANTDVSGEITLSMAGVSGIPSGSGSLVEIGFTISPDAEAGTEIVLDFGDGRIYDELGMDIPVILENGIVRIKQPGIKGDVNNDGAVRANDATLALRIAAQLLVPTEYQLWAADMNDDGAVRANDATLILRKAAGLAAPGSGILASNNRNITVMFTEAHGIMGERITVPIKVDNAGMLSSGDICIAYDSAVLKAVGVSSSSGVMLAGNVAEPGLVRIAFASASGLRSQTIAEIQFDVLADANSELQFRTVELYGIDALPVQSTGMDRRFLPWSKTPKHNALLQNFPNPFNPETWIPYQLSQDTEVIIRIYSTTGQLIRTMDLGYRESGSYATRGAAAYWDGTNEIGESVASGIYFYTIQAGDFTATKKMTIVE